MARPARSALATKAMPPLWKYILLEVKSMCIKAWPGSVDKVERGWDLVPCYLGSAATGALYTNDEYVYTSDWRSFLGITYSRLPGGHSSLISVYSRNKSHLVPIYRASPKIKSPAETEPLPRALWVDRPRFKYTLIANWPGTDSKVMISLSEHCVNVYGSRVVCWQIISSYN